MKTEENFNTPLLLPDYVINGVLENGFRYFIMEHKKPKDRILLWLVVEVGSLHEKPSERGIAHYIEHMAFKGSMNFRSGEIMDFFHNIGVETGAGINALTGIDRTVYKIEIPSDNEEALDKALISLSDYGCSISFPGEEVEKERQVILEEIRICSDLQDRISNQHGKIKFKGSSYDDKNPIGKEEIVKKITSGDLRKFYLKWYRPDNMFLLAIGDITPEKIKDKIINIFGNLPSAKKKINNYVPFKSHKEIYTGIIKDMELKQSSIYITYLRDPLPVKTVGDYKRKLLNNIIFEIINMRLIDETVNNISSPLTQAGCALASNYKSLNEVRFICTIKNDDIIEALTVLYGYIEGVRQYGFSAFEFEEAVRQVFEDFKDIISSMKSIDSESYASVLSRTFIRDGIYTDPQEGYELAGKLIPLITPDEIKKYIRELFRPINMSVVIMTPPEINITEDEITCRLENVLSGGGIKYKTREINYVYDYGFLKPGNIVSRKFYKKLNITSLNLSNGLKVILKPTDFENRIYMSYFSSGGKLFETPDKPGMFDVAKMSWAVGGTEDLSQVEVERLIKRKSISFNTAGTALYGLHGYCPSDSPEELCQWFWQYLSRPGYSEEGIDYAIKMNRENINSLEETQEYLLMEEENKLMLYGNPLAIKYSAEDLEGYRNNEALRMFQELSCVPVNSQLTFTGSFDLREAVNLACKYFGSLPPGQKTHIPDCYFNTSFPPGKVRKIIYKGIGDRCVGNIIFPGLMGHDEDFPALELLVKILNKRLWNTVREEKSLVYSVNTENYPSLIIKGYGMVKVYFGTSPDKIDEVINSVFQEIDRLKNCGVSGEELNSAKKILIPIYEQNIESNIFWFENLNKITFLDYDMKKLVQYGKDVLKVTKKDILTVLEKYLDKENNITLICLPVQN